MATTAVTLAAAATPAPAASGPTRPAGEVKVMLDPARLGRVRRRLGLGRPSKRQKIYFFDHEDRSLMASGLVLRVRRTRDRSSRTGYRAKLTVKLRPERAARDGSGWPFVPGWKHEIDRVDGRGIATTSLSAEIDDRLVKRVIAGKGSVRSLLLPAQRAMLAARRPDLDLDLLRVHGPIPARVWTVDDSPLGVPLNLELWQVGPDKRFLELSSRTSARRAPALERAMRRWIDGQRLLAPGTQETKTSAALSLLDVSTM